MDKNIRERLLGINQQFYQKTAQTFDRSRQSSWPGWFRLLPWIKTLEGPVAVLDLACGNGRWGQFVVEQKIALKSYTGIDQNKELLSKAKVKLRAFNPKLIQFDLGTKELIKVRADVVVAFGWLHHLPGKNQRLEWFKKIAMNVNPGGYLMVSFWQLRKDPRQMAKKIPWELVGLKESEVESGDFLLNWQNSGIARYCHHFGNQELSEYGNLKYMEKKDEFEADGKTGKLNRYMVFRKQKSG